MEVCSFRQTKLQLEDIYSFIRFVVHSPHPEGEDVEIPRDTETGSPRFIVKGKEHQLGGSVAHCFGG